ncbi:putative oxidoreductase YcjS [Symmachiella dynata]|uniref:Putative oxidoreductase YcjS n=1 Tax=Symmachiella dynata TaxID=2527995 RepID=A0A517ZJB0_9PLAN|nr:Gfo/Idh/MocA family oxidoreductase [Symmachiella dynata]QDU42564.1 putative oxidoreductase YcjS [Symmachiella dynata]
MSAMNRRGFLGTTLVAAGTLASAAPVKAAANDTVGVAVLGAGRGANLAAHFAALPDSQVVAICEVDAARGQKLAERVQSISGKRPPVVTDFRTLLDQQDVDALAVATPDHWHAPATILGCAAGKDVYVEKPASHNVAEGRMAVNAARKFDRIVQHGTNLRAAPHYEEAWELLRQGVIGKVLMVKAINNQRRGRLAQRQDEATPAGVDYNMWLGPAEKRAFNRNRFHSSWHWNWEYGTGDIGNDGVHQIDLGRWALGLKAPKSVSAMGAKLGSKGDAQETPDTMVVTWEYDDLLFVYEQRDFTPYRMQGHRLDNDNIFYGDQGYLMIDRDGYRVFHKGGERGPVGGEKWVDSPRHFQNFIDCVKSRDRNELIADIEEGHYSALLCHLGNASFRTGRRLQFDGEAERFVDDEEANRYLARDYRQGFELPVI